MVAWLPSKVLVKKKKRKRRRHFCLSFVTSCDVDLRKAVELTFTKAVEDSTGRGDDRERTQHQRYDEFQVSVDGIMLGDVTIDFHGRQGCANVRLQRLYLILGHRRACIVVSPYANVVRRPWLQFAQSIRLLHLYGNVYTSQTSYQKDIYLFVKI